MIFLVELSFKIKDSCQSIQVYESTFSFKSFESRIEINEIEIKTESSRKLILFETLISLALKQRYLIKIKK